jgi:hypothetical protein
VPADLVIVTEVHHLLQILVAVAEEVAAVPVVVEHWADLVVQVL